VKSGSGAVVVSVAPDNVVVHDLLAHPLIPLPALRGITQTPVVACDGSICVTPGYQPSTQLYYAPADGFIVPAIPEHPTDSEIAQARGLLLELVCDFPFVGDADLAHALALLLLPFARNLIDGPTPLHLVSKPTPGTGGTLLVVALTYPALGCDVAAKAAPASEDEMRKAITAELATGSAFIFFDNLSEELNSSSLAAAITSRRWTDRILGTSTTLELLVNCGWVASGNNPTLGRESARRTVLTRLDSKLERPQERTEFKHPDLKGWARSNRGAVVGAALTLIRAWIDRGRPPATATLGMFESWSCVVGGILNTAGVPGLLRNMPTVYQISDAETARWRLFIAAWWSMFGDRPQGTGNLLLVGDQLGLTGYSTRAQSTQLGKLLGQRENAIFTIPNPSSGGQIIQVGLRRSEPERGQATWKLETCMSAQ
jgi:hypothetical protein